MLKKWWKRFQLRNKIENQKLKKRFQGKENIEFNVKLFLYSLCIMFVFIMITGMMFGPYNIFKEINYQSGKDDGVVKTLVQYCSYEKTDNAKIYCVNSFVNEHFEYIINKKIINPDDLIENGGDCKSWTNFYIIVLRQLGIKVTQDFNSVDNHTFAIADTEEGYCILDQRNVDCHYLGNGQSYDNETGNYIQFS